MPMRSPGECRWRPGGAPVYRCTEAIPGHCRHSPGLHRGTTGDNRDVIEALTGYEWAPMELRYRPGCSRCRAGRFRSFPVTPGGI
ncbi:hypothetical protein DPMN_016698 [Dreissena polymorpha]|uniref:Uncharacterized protein n=1 Tax=Dreissena polymorpha TaxID=45954 RepID=A0A9D4NFA8_DREPO|nr:hypothetical protein DPMN_016698 [Dreissena polymorpha]